MDVEGIALPALVYLSREKQPQYSHNFKAGAMNALVELAGLVDAFYMGTGCFHRRESLCGRKYCNDYKETLSNGYERIAEESTEILEDRAEIVATCSYEDNSDWGKNMGLMYGFVVEDIVTGLSIQGRGWKSIYFNPARKGFLGIAPSTLELLLVQQKRWSEGLFQIFISKYCPFLYGHGKINLRLQMAYSIYLLWAPLSLPVLYFVIIPSLCLLNGIPLFPRISSSWFIPFAYIITATQAYSLSEALWCGETVGSWWNMQKTRMMKRTGSYFFGFMDIVFQLLGIGKSSFTITAKVADDNEASKRFEEGILEFG